MEEPQKLKELREQYNRKMMQLMAQPREQREALAESNPLLYQDLERFERDVFPLLLAKSDEP